MKQILLLLLSGFLICACGHHQHGSPQNTSATTSDSAAIVYACPMDCEKGKTYAQAGDCPVCGMALEAQTAAPAAPLSKALSDKAGAVHDEAMKELAEMNRVGRRMKDFMQKAKMTKEYHDKYADVLAAMEKAEAGMMSWMAQYREPTDLSPEAAQQYLNDQIQKIEQNKKDIHTALEAGKSLLQQ